MTTYRREEGTASLLFTAARQSACCIPLRGHWPPGGGPRWPPASRHGIETIVRPDRFRTTENQLIGRRPR
jgi:hypothetical protein